MALNPPVIAYSIEDTYSRRILRIHFTDPTGLGVLITNIIITDAVTGNLIQNINKTYTSPDGIPYSVVHDIRLTAYYDISALNIQISAYIQYTSEVLSSTTAEVTESTRARRLSPLTVLPQPLPFAYLKAFCNLPDVTFENVYVFWEKSSDGVSWEEYDLADEVNVNIDFTSVENLKCSVVDPTYDIDGNLTQDSNTYALRTVWRLDAKSPLDRFDMRPDVIRIPQLSGVDSTMYRMRMCTVKSVKSGDTGYISGAEYTEKTSLGTVIYTPVLDTSAEILRSEISNASLSYSQYYGTSLYAYGNPDFKNNLIISNPGETVRPLSRMLPLNTNESSYVTAITPWKNYMLCFTEHSVHLVTPLDDGFTANTVNTFIGIPFNDRRCCVPTLNGVIFKSGTKLYMLYPNIYAGSDSVLNVTEISSPIETYLEDYTPAESVSPFAIGTDSHYILLIPTSNTTLCIKYNYTDKRWSTYEYPFVALDYEMLSLDDIRITGYTVVGGIKSYGEYLIDNEYSDVFSEIPENVPYADIVKPVADLQHWSNLDAGTFTPIHFVFDSGQKADSLNQYKQFVESKFNLATLHEKDSFPMRITVHVDGCPYVTTKDVNTDSSFWKESTEHLGTLNTPFITSDSDIFNVFRQMFVRYSGKGRSIRHIIEGESLYPFKIYEINYRYRNLNVKQ